MTTVMTRAALVMFLAAAGFGQGAGVVGATGVEPRVRVAGRTAGAPATLLIDRLVASSAPNVTVAVSPATAHVPLTAFGAPQAVVGIDLSLATQLPALTVPASGQIQLAFTVPASWIGSTFHVQVIQVDTGAPSGFALSDVETVTFGATDDRIVASMGASTSTQDLAVVFADGSAVGPLATDLQGVEILDVDLAAVGNTLPLDGTVPWLDRSVPGRTAVRLPSGARIYHFRDATGQYGFMLVDPDGRRAEVLVRAPAIAGAPPFSPTIAVSPFEPLAAIMAEGPVAGLSGGPVFILRTDGENHAGSPRPVLGIPFSGPLAGYDPKEKSMTFLDGALLLSDRVTLVRVPTTTLTPQTITLPPSGGQTPTEVDDEIAWAADGLSAALTAGSSETSRDVYVVTAAGAATNVTQSPGSYEEAGHGDVLDGGRLALSADGARVAFVKEVAQSPELFVKPVAGGAAVHLTDNATFVSTIDQEVTIHFYASADVSFTAGGATNDHDVYKAQAANGTVTNLTLTGAATQPFPVGTLTPTGFARGPGGSALYTLQAQSGQTSVVLNDTLGAPLLNMTGIDSMASLPGGPASFVVVSTSGATTVHRLDATLATMGTITGTAARPLAARSTSTLVATQETTGERLWLFDATAGPIGGPTAWAWAGGARPLGTAWLAISRSASGQAGLVRIEASGSAATIVTAPGFAYVY